MLVADYRLTHTSSDIIVPRKCIEYMNKSIRRTNQTKWIFMLNEKKNWYLNLHTLYVNHSTVLKKTLINAP
ncbi:hypothetical protein MYP_3098 [Sporocytophaga myxococcoides]|uniref:Uncharacterized protein n=1 Tax=Sporocytophaga myxococcoides TaxID=153721 RepID=A0A098LHF0_9BACT|nr:hypothetical protein MYP_3098 [Sporocytophaga myxococcoides]